jgi:hypothetical protein
MRTWVHDARIRVVCGCETNEHVRRSGDMIDGHGQTSSQISRGGFGKGGAWADVTT